MLWGVGLLPQTISKFSIMVVVILQASKTGASQVAKIIKPITGPTKHSSTNSQVPHPRKTKLVKSVAKLINRIPSNAKVTTVVRSKTVVRVVKRQPRIAKVVVLVVR